MTTIVATGLMRKAARLDLARNRNSGARMEDASGEHTSATVSSTVTIIRTKRTATIRNAAITSSNAPVRSIVFSCK